jgi:secretion/DNA translocation related TadE-like protein
VNRRSRDKAPRDHGSASLVCLAVGLALAALAFGFSTLAGAVVASHRARNAADSAALAGAMAVQGRAGVAVGEAGAGVACAAADRLAVQNGGRLAACTVVGVVVTVTVEVRTRMGTGARAAARAGPVGSA